MIFDVIKGRIILVKKQDKGVKAKQKVNFGSTKNHDSLHVYTVPPAQYDPFYRLYLYNYFSAMIIAHVVVSWVYSDARNVHVVQ